MTNYEKVILLLQWVSENREGFKKQFQLNAWTKVFDIDLYIDKQIAVVNRCVKEKYYGNEFYVTYMRLYELKQYNERQNKKD